jgi:hypothetical protein
MMLIALPAAALACSGTSASLEPDASPGHEDATTSSDGGHLDAGDAPCRTGWALVTVEDESAASGRYNSIAIDDYGRRHLAFRNAPFAHGHMSYAMWIDEAWSILTGVGPVFGGDIDYVSIDVAAGGAVHAATYDIASGYLQYATIAGGLVDELEPIGDLDFVRGVSLVVDPAERPHVVYHDVEPPFESLWYSRRVDGTWVAEVVDKGDFAGIWPALALDGDSFAHIAHGDFHVRYSTNASGAWVTEVVDDGEMAAIAIDSAGTVHIAYTTGGEARYSRRVDGSDWLTETIDSTEVRKEGTGVWGASLAIGPAGQTHVAYYVRPDLADPDRVEVRYGLRDADGWGVETVDQEHISDRDYQSSLVVDPDGIAHVAYYDGHMRYASRSACEPIIP